MRLLLFLCLPIFSFAQWKVSGYILDEANLPYQHIEIRITQLNLTVFTDQKGFYLFDSIPSGSYALSIDYGYDTEYRKIDVLSQNVNFSVVLERRINFDEIVVYGDKWHQQQAVSQISLNEKSIRDLDQTKDLPYTLNALPSAQVQSDAGNGLGYTGIRLRGVDPTHIQINLNGIPMNDAESSIAYFVDIPDILASTDELSVSTGFVPSRNGPGAFGASIDLFLNKLYFKPFALVSTGFGDYHTRKFSVNLNTGLFEDAYNIEFRYSRLDSDGFIDRSKSKLRSLFLSMAKIKKNYSIRCNVIHGTEVTGQAWFGLPIQYFAIDSLYTYNSAGQEKGDAPYENENDDYKQTHVQLFYNHILNKKSNFSLSSQYTYGNGYYENYKADKTLREFGLTHPDTSSADIIRLKWLTNHFLFMNASIETGWNKYFSSQVSLSYSHYQGYHFGQAVWAHLTQVKGLGSNYYDNTGKKDELNWSGKLNYKLNSRFTVNGELQTRFISYQIDGLDDVYGTIHRNFNAWLWNPKLLAHYKLNSKIETSFSTSFYQREPYREDLLSNVDVKKEQLLDLELGIKMQHQKSLLILNSYVMEYRNQLAYNGGLNDTGEPLRVNVPKSFRRGVELLAHLDVFKYLQFDLNGNLSINKVSHYVEELPVYNANYELVNQELVEHDNVDLSYSPNRILFFQIKIPLLFSNHKIEILSLVFNQKWVGSQYLNLANYSDSRLPEYSYSSCRLNFNLPFKYAKWSSYFQISNLANTRFSTHGWSTRFKSTELINVGSDPYLSSTSSEYNAYKGVFPQALRHWNLGISIQF